LNAKEQLVEIETAMREEEYELALQLLSPILQRSERQETAWLWQARCQLALHRHEDSAITYRFILDNPLPFSDVAQAEAQLALGREQRAATLLTGRRKAPETLLLAAVTVYRLGRIPECLENLKAGIRQGWEWKDEDPISPLIQHVLIRQEFLDFEQLYLDAQDIVTQGVENGKNRWFALNMPIYELYTASSPEKQQKRATALMELLTPGENLDVENSRVNLELILRDFAASQTDASFGLDSLTKLQSGEWGPLASNILAIQLEHLGQFVKLLGLMPQSLQSSRLQEIIQLLPQRIAICLLLLYTISGGEDRAMQQMQGELDARLTHALILAGFKGYYQEIARIRSLQPSHPVNGQSPQPRFVEIP